MSLNGTYGIVTEHGGTIAIENSDEGGAVFTIELPLAESEVAAEA